MCSNYKVLKAATQFGIAGCLVLILNLGLGVGEMLPAQAASLPQLLVNGAVLNSEGAQVAALPNQPPDIYRTAYQWSPDGSKIAYLLPQGLGVINADGSGKHDLVNGSREGAFAWSPDSRHIAFTNYSFQTEGSTKIFKADGSDVKEITGLVGNIIGWKADNSQLLVAESYFNAGVDSGVNVKAVNSDGSGLRTLFTIQGYVGRINLWYDGKRIFYSKTDAPGIGAEYKYYVTNLDGTGTVEFPESASVAYIFSSSKRKAATVYYNFGKESRLAIMDINDPAGTQKLIPITDRIVDATFIPDTDDIIVAVALAGEKIRLDRINSKTLDRTPLFEVPGLVYVAQDYEGISLNIISMEIEPATGLLAFTHVKRSRGSITGADRQNFTYIINLNSKKTITVENKVFYGWQPTANSITYGNILPDFYNIWKQSDLAVANGQSKSSWLWGPDAFATKTEDYKEAPNGKRQVQYFDKARMEINNPNADRSNLYFVTNGLLPKELISGQMQIGENSFVEKVPAEVNVAGDDGGSVTYAKLVGVTTLEVGKNAASDRTGQPITAAIDRSGKVSQRDALQEVSLAQYIKETQHNIPNVFWDYFKTLPQDWLFVMGYPLSEPYITEITLAGKPTIAMVQVFERRVLTYTPSNPDLYKVEQGNVGRHYYQWRYVD